VRVGVDIRLDLPALAPLAHDAVADDVAAVAHDASVPLEIELRPLALQVALRERRRAVQRRLGRLDDLRHRRRVGDSGGCGLEVRHEVA
jgi:hypothetical protein